MGVIPSTLGDRARISMVESRDRDGPVRSHSLELSCCRASLTGLIIGLVTDYGSSMVQWMRTRRPRYKGGHRMEVERPSASYAVDVSSWPCSLCLDTAGGAVG